MTETEHEYKDYRCPECGFDSDEPGTCTGKAESPHAAAALERFSPPEGSGSSGGADAAQTGAQGAPDQAPPAV